MKKLKLLSLAVIGTGISYVIINNLVQQMDLWTYLVIEVIIGAFHHIYNVAKKEILI